MTCNNKRIQTFLEHLYSIDFNERPVSVNKFLDNVRYLGNSTEKGNAVYPVWRETLTELMAEDSKYLGIFTGAIGTGKTRCAVWGLAYIMYRILCLKNPWKYFGLAPGGKLSIPFFNLTKNLGLSTSYQLLHSFILNSPWFLERGIVRGTQNLYLDIPLFDYKLASPYAQGFGTLGQDVITGIMDEVDSPNESEKKKIRVLDAYNNTSRRFISRFVDPLTGETLGKLFIVSSKQETVSFLSTFITERKNSPEVYVKDIAIWEAKAGKSYSGETFFVMVGDAYIDSKIIITPKEIKEARESDYKLIKIPVEYKDAFMQDINGALRDLAGVSVLSSRSSKLFSSELILLDCYDKTKANPVSKSTIMVGLRDKIDLMRFIDFSKIRVPLHFPRFIHCDIAFSGNGDAFGIGMSAISGWTRINHKLYDGNFEERKLAVVETDFALRLKGKPGDQIDLSAIRRFILDLRLMGFNIGKVTADHRAMSIDTCQILENVGINTGYLSLDRSPESYLLFRDIVRENRWLCHKDNYLHFELSNLEYDTIKNKIDHPEKVVRIVFLENNDTKEVVIKGSKDKADGVVGSVVSALENTEVPPDREIIRNLLQQASNNKPSSTLVRSSDMDVIKDNLLGMSGDISKKDNKNKTSTKAQTLASIFNKINKG